MGSRRSVSSLHSHSVRRLGCFPLEDHRQVFSLTVSLGVLFPLALAVDHPVARLRLYLLSSGFTVVLRSTNQSTQSHKGFQNHYSALLTPETHRNHLSIRELYPLTTLFDNIIMEDPTAVTTEVNKPEVRPTAEQTHLPRRLIPPAM
jgi:hypothetical protein